MQTAHGRRLLLTQSRGFGSREEVNCFSLWFQFGIQVLELFLAFLHSPYDLFWVSATRRQINFPIYFTLPGASEKHNINDLLREFV